MALPNKTTRQQVKRTAWGIPLHVNNMKVFAIGMIVIIAGFILLSTGITSDETKYLDTWNNTLSNVIATIVLVIGYCVIIPYALMMKSKENTK